MESECVRDLVQPVDGQEDCQARAGGGEEDGHLLSTEEKLRKREGGKHGRRAPEIRRCENLQRHVGMTEQCSLNIYVPSSLIVKTFVYYHLNEEI